MEEKIKRIQEGDKNLLEEVIKDNLDYIHSFTIKYYDIYDDYDELVQIAMCTFLNLIYNFDGKKEFYKNYCNYWMYIYIRDYLIRNINHITDENERYYLCVNAYETCRRSLKHIPTIKELKYFFAINYNVADYIMYAIENGCFNDVEVYNNDIYSDDFSLEEFCNENIDEMLFKEKYFKVLTSQQQKVISLKYGFDRRRLHGSADIGKIMGISRQAADFYHKAAIKKLDKKCGKSLKKYY